MHYRISTQGLFNEIHVNEPTENGNVRQNFYDAALSEITEEGLGHEEESPTNNISRKNRNEKEASTKFSNLMKDLSKISMTNIGYFFGY